MILDDRDRQILSELQTDGRLSNAELAERVHLSASACLRRVNLLMESGLVAGAHLVLDQQECVSAWNFDPLEGVIGVQF